MPIPNQQNPGLPQGKNTEFAEKFQSVGLPILGLLETLGTAFASGGRHVSPGTGFLKQQQILQGAKDKQRQFALQQEAAKGQALERKIKQFQLGSLERGQKRTEETAARRASLEKALGLAKSPEEQQNVLEQHAQSQAIQTDKVGEFLTKRTERKQKKTSEMVKREKEITKEYQGRSADWGKVSDQYRGFLSTIKNNKKKGLGKEQGGHTGASDLQLIFSFMKALDPRSTVRESEQKAAQATGGVWAQIKGWMNNVKGQGSLDVVSRKQLMTAMEGPYDQQLEKQKNTVLIYANKALNAGLEPNEIAKTVNMVNLDGTDVNLRKEISFLTEAKKVVDDPLASEDEREKAILILQKLGVR